MKRAILTVSMLLLFSPVWSASTLSWRTDFDAAMKEAQQNSKAIFVDVYTDWCEWCHKLDKDVYTDPTFIKHMANYVPVKINAEDSKKGSQFASKYHVDGFPTLLVTDAKGNVINRITGFLSAQELVQDLSSIQDLMVMEQKRPGDPSVNANLGIEYLGREMYAEAENRFQKVLKSPAATTPQKESAQYSLGLAQYYDRNLKDSLNSLETYYQTYTTGESREDALLLLSQVHIELESNEKARAILKEFLAQYPRSDNKARAQQVLALIEKDLSKSHH